MARSKTMTIKAPAGQLLALSHALSVYAEAAWPPGGSDCAQASREALLSTARAIADAQQNSPGIAEFSRRQKATVRSALEYASTIKELEPNREIYQTLLVQLTPSGDR